MSEPKEYLFENEHAGAQVCIGGASPRGSLLLIDGSVVLLHDDELSHPAIKGYLDNGTVKGDVRPRLTLVNRPTPVPKELPAAIDPHIVQVQPPNIDPAPTMNAQIEKPTPEPEMPTADPEQTLKEKISLMNSMQLEEFAMKEYGIELDQRQNLNKMQTAFWDAYHQMEEQKTTEGKRD